MIPLATTTVMAKTSFLKELKLHFYVFLIIIIFLFIFYLTTVPNIFISLCLASSASCYSNRHIKMCENNPACCSTDFGVWTSFQLFELGIILLIKLSNKLIKYWSVQTVVPHIVSVSFIKCAQKPPVLQHSGVQWPQLAEVKPWIDVIGSSSLCLPPCQSNWPRPTHKHTHF